MKRSILIAVPLAAAVTTAGLASAQTPVLKRVPPKAISASTNPKSDRTLNYTFTTKGTLTIPDRSKLPTICPPGATSLAYCVAPTKATICSGGRVSVIFKKKGTTISSRQANLDRNCHYTSTVPFHTRLHERVGTLTVRVRFQGNQFLLPRIGPVSIVHAG